MLPTWAITVFKHAVCPVMCENGIQTIYGERALLPCVCVIKSYVLSLSETSGSSTNKSLQDEHKRVIFF